MTLPIYLAMTPWEFRHCPIPQHCGWMGCHFAFDHKGLSGLPEQLPADSLLIVDDSIPICGHDPDRIRDQLLEAVQALKPYGILLDLQRQQQPEIPKLLAQLHGQLPCPTAVSASYAEDWDGPILVPPIPPDMCPEEYLQPWKDRSVWLEVDSGALVLTLTKDGCQCQSEPVDYDEAMQQDTRLHCHYRISTESDRANFSFTRTWQDLQALTACCHAALAVGLYQELFYLSTGGHRLW